MDVLIIEAGVNHLPDPQANSLKLPVLPDRSSTVVKE